MLAGGRGLQVWADAGWLYRSTASKNVVGLGKGGEFCYNGGKWPRGGLDVLCRGCRFCRRF